MYSSTTVFGTYGFGGGRKPQPVRSVPVPKPPSPNFQILSTHKELVTAAHGFIPSLAAAAMHSRKCATTTATTTKTTSQIKWAARRRALQRRKLVGSTRTPRAAMNDDDVVEPSAGKAFSQQAMTDFCVALACRTGLLYGPPEQCTPAPTTLVPAAFPRASYERAVQLAPAMTRLADATCVDPAWLEQALAAAARADVFTDALIRVRSAAEPTRAAAAGSLLACTVQTTWLTSPRGGSCRWS